MSFNDYFCKVYYLIVNPNNIYKKGRNDALNEIPRRQYRLAYFFEHFKEDQKLYNKGYDDGLKERLINKL